MANEKEIPTKFRPERPIYLNEENTGLRTRAEVEEVVEKLRARPYHYLCKYGEKTRPFHMSFNNEADVNEFKKACAEVGFTPKSKLITEDDLEDFAREETAGANMPEDATANSTSEDPSGRVHIE